MILFDNFSALPSAIGTDLGSTSYMPITQDMIDQFASATLDNQWIHTDPDKAAVESPYGGVIAQGFLTLSLMSGLVRELCCVPAQMCINHGFNNIRFTDAVPVNSRVRLTGIVKDVRIFREKNAYITLEVAVEVEGKNKPALKAEWLLLAIA
jgi:acyl dehydratase